MRTMKQSNGRISSITHDAWKIEDSENKESSERTCLEDLAFPKLAHGGMYSLFRSEIPSHRNMRLSFLRPKKE